MCQQIVQFCSSSARPLVYAGSFLLLLTSIALGYTACTTNALYRDLDEAVAQDKSLNYHLQLAASGYLVLVTLLACVAAHYDNKNAVRALAVLAAINFVLCGASLLMVPRDGQTVGLFEERLRNATSQYDYKSKPEPIQTQQATGSPDETSRNPQKRYADATEQSNAAKDATTAPPKSSQQPQAEQQGPVRVSEPLTKERATCMWDRLQARGCCGIGASAETYWSKKLPKSCCAQPNTSDSGELTCAQVDKDHEKPCEQIINMTNMNLMIVLALVALVNLYLATVSGVNAYRTLHYDEANQGAYT